MQRTYRAAILAVVLIVSALIGMLLWPGGQPGEGARVAREETMAEADGPRFEIRGLTLERDYGNARLEIEVLFENRRPSALTLQPPDVQLFAGEGEAREEVANFALAFQNPPQIPGREAKQVQLRYWLEARHLQGPLILRIDDHDRTIKTAEPIELESFENGRPAKVRRGPWTTR